MLPRSRNQAVGAHDAATTPVRLRLRARTPGSRAVGPAVWTALALFLGASSRGQEPEAPAGPNSAPSPAEPASLPAPSRATTLAATDVAAMRAEAAQQLKESDASSSTGVPTSAAATSPGAGPHSATPAAPSAEAAADQSLRGLLQERLRWLDEYEKASRALKLATHPEPTPEKQAADAKAELRRLQESLARADKEPETLLPPAFRGPAVESSKALGAEMKDALEATTNELKQWKAKLEVLRAEIANGEGQQTAQRAERDKLFHGVATAKARVAEREPVADAATAKVRRLAQERRANAELAARVEALRLQAVEAQMALEPRLAGVRELTLQVDQAHVALARRTLELMQARYSAAAKSREDKLKSDAAHEEDKASRSDDPLVRFRALRLAELLKLEALVVKNEQTLATSPPPSLDEQRGLADHAEGDFARIKQLLDDGRVSRLDAIRLNNDFRRIGPERDRLLRNEMATVEARLQYYEDALTNVELELLQDSLHDRFDHELLRERLPASRWTEGESLLAELEQKHRTILARRRAALERLAECAAQTMEQVARRLRVLEEEYGFIRTHIFWVRDREPIGVETVSRAGRELQHLAKAMALVAQETTKGRLWGPPSAEFLASAVALLALPIGLVRVRRGLRGLIERDLPAP